MVSIEDESGNLILSLEELNLVALGEGTVTEEIQLVIGQYNVTEFLIVNESNEAVYVAPLEGSEMAAHVENPLLVSFQVGETIQESVSIEVLEVVPGSTPIDFGLIDFPIDFINLFQVDISIIKDDLPTDGMVTLEGYKNRSLLWTEQIYVEGTASIRLYDNVDTIIIDAIYGDLWLEKSYTLEQIQNNPQVLFNFSDIQNFVIEVVGLDRDVDYAIGTLSSENDLHKIFFEGDEARNLLVGNFQRIIPGTYTLAISIFEGENLITDPEARGSLYKGVESYEPIEIVLNQPRIIVQGPDILSNNTNYEPDWSERYFYTFSDRSAVDSDIVWSTPEQPCEFDLRILPEKLNPQPEFVYIDYFIYSEMNGSTVLGYEECLDCDPFVHIESFFETLSSNGSVDLCEAKDWDIADSMMILDFGGDVGEVYFFMKWDTDGTYFEFLDNGRIDTKKSKDQFKARSLPR